MKELIIEILRKNAEINYDRDMMNGLKIHSTRFEEIAKQIETEVKKYKEKK
jgi:predicted nuclease with TOPRIM domain